MERLESLLDEIRQAALTADFPRLGTLSARMEQALTDGAFPRDAATLSRLQAQAEANARLIDAASRGIRAARRRVEEARRTQQGLQTYDGHGRRADIAPQGQTAGRF